MDGPNEVFGCRQRHFNGKYERQGIQFHRAQFVDDYYIGFQSGMLDCCYGYALKVRQIHVVLAYELGRPSERCVQECRFRGLKGLRG